LPKGILVESSARNVVVWVSRSEGPPDALNRNLDGQGLSFGVLQWTQRSGNLVRNRATHFLDAPKRWNVALTRAMQGLFIFGDVDAYLREAAAANTRRGGPRPPISILAKVLDAYSRQIHRAGTGRPS
jgi:hypothetical protein